MPEIPVENFVAALKNLESRIARIEAYLFRTIA
jgi:hypothetical protein